MTVNSVMVKDRAPVMMVKLALSVVFVDRASFPGVSHPLFGVTLFAFYVSFRSSCNFLHGYGWLLRQGFVEMSRLETVMEG
jgi:hypothetical protein